MQNASKNILKKAKIFTLIELAHPKDFNKVDLGLQEMPPSFRNSFKTKFSKMHNFAANHLLKTVTVNMYGEHKIMGNT